jgi:hypothetical protein
MVVPMHTLPLMMKVRVQVQTMRVGLDYVRLLGQTSLKI